MKLFVIPSWYPSEAFPATGIFFKEQAGILAKQRPDWSVGVSLWGSHEPKLWLQASRPLHSLIQYASKFPVKQHDHQLQSNLAEFFTPAYTWSRRLAKGNIKGIIAASKQNFERYRQVFGKPDLIHAHVAYPAGYIALHLSREYNVPYIVTEHMSPFPMNSFQKDFRRILLPPLKNANRTLGVSAELVRRLQHYDIDAEKASNFIDDEFFRPLRATSEVFTFVTVCRIELQKGLPYLLDAIKMLRKEHFEFRVRIIGDGSLKRSLLKESDKFNLRVDWLGERDRAAVRDELQRSDVFVLPSLHENQPVAILEALACGLPVISTNWAGADEMISEASGIIVKKRDAEDLADGMRKMMNGVRLQRAQVRDEFERKYATKMVIDELEQHYRRVLD